MDWGRKDAACGMAEEDGVKMSGLRLDRPAAPRLGCARGVTGVTGRTDEQTTRCRIISFHSAGEAFVPPLNEVTVGHSRSCFLYLSFSGAPRGTRVISWNEEGRSQREMRRRMRMKTCSLLSFAQRVLPFLFLFSLPTRGPGECIEKLAQDITLAAHE